VGAAAGVGAADFAITAAIAGPSLAGQAMIDSNPSTTTTATTRTLFHLLFIRNPSRLQSIAHPVGF